MERVQTQLHNKPVDIDYEKDGEDDKNTDENKEVPSRIVLKYVVPFLVLILVIVYFGSRSVHEPPSNPPQRPNKILGAQKPLITILPRVQETDPKPAANTVSSEYVDAIKRKSVENDSNSGWSADSFMRVLDKPGLQSRKNQVLSQEEAFKEFKRKVQGDAYLSALSSDASELSVSATKINQDVKATIRDLMDEKELTSQEAIIVTVKRGDTLSLIANRFLGSSIKYDKLFEANRDILVDPDVIVEGQRIRVPQQQ